MPESRDSLTRLQELAALQQQTNTALLALMDGRRRPSDEAYEHYLELARRLVAGVAAFEAESPGGFEVSGFAQPLVQWLSMYADHRQAAGDSEAANRLREEADAVAATYLGAAATARVRRDRAMLAATEGRFHDALNGLAHARAAFDEAGMLLDRVQTDLQLANAYEWLGDHERALATLASAHDQVAPLLEKGPPSTAQVFAGVARQLGGIMRGRNTKEGEDLLALQRIAFEVVQSEARNSRLTGRYDEAERLFLQARPFAVELGIPAGIDFHLAVIAVARRDAPTARRLLTNIAPAFESGLIRPRRAALRQVQADLRLLLDDPREALALAEDGLRDQATYPDLDLAWKLQWRRAKALSALGEGAQAIDAFRAGMSDADRLRMAPLGYRLDTTFVRDKLPMAEEAVDTALAHHDAGAVALFVELVKSRALAATISVPRVPAADRTEQEAEFDTLSQQIDALAFAQYSGTGSAGALQERLDLIARRDALLEQIRIGDPRWRAMTEPARVDLVEIRAALGPSRAALVLHHRRRGDGQQVIAALVDAVGIVADARSLEPGTTVALTKFVENLRKPRPDDFLFDLSSEEGVGVEQLLPARIVERLGSTETLLVVPHGVLHLLPWACLTAGSERLFERCAVGLLPNLASLPLLDSEPGTDARVAIIGAADYHGLTKYGVLTESPEEIEDVAATYGKRMVARPVTGPGATETAFWSLAGKAGAGDVLHYSGHGSLEATEPLASGLVLTGSTVDAAEILIRRLPYAEVVLSACSTAWRPQATRDLELAGDDALGLPASFLEAGARFLLASIPPVREKASRAFTVAWHRHRRAGHSPLQAYRSVQLDALNAQPGNVFAWAGMTAYGCR
jgi:tetratricopeptide (TPR) repeat protein